MKFPGGKDLCTVRIGEKGQIVIPKNMREMFGIKPGDTLLLLADERRGIAVLNDYDAFKEMLGQEAADERQ